MLLEPLRSPRPPPLGAPALVAVVLAAAALAVALLVSTAHFDAVPPSNAFWDERPESAAEETLARVWYVGYDPASFDAARGYDPARVRAAVERFADAHWSETVTRAIPVMVDGRVVGVRFTTEPSQTLPPRGLPDDLADAPQRPLGVHAIDWSA